MAQRKKRSISLPPELAAAIDAAAGREGLSVSAWIAETAVRRLRLEAGRRGIAEWEREHGALTAEELAIGLARARELLEPVKTSRRRAS
jgi:Ribbon-helix-helix protein, copG family